MFDANFLANLIVWRWINEIGARIFVVLLFAVAFSVLCAMSGVYLPAILLIIAGLLVFLVIRHAIRRQAALQTWRDSVLPGATQPWEGRTEPQLYPAAQMPDAGLRASASSRWPVSR
jgi:hypothetical protein